MIDESALIKRVLAGDVNEFRLLVHRYHKPVISMICHLTNDRHLAEDIAQETFLAAYKKLSSFDSARSEFSTWLFTIARRLSINTLKKKKPIILTQLPDKPDPHRPPDELARKELFDQLDLVLNTLPIKQKTAFILAEFENLPYAEIARIENNRLGTIKSRINRAKAKLAHALKAYAGDKP